MQLKTEALKNIKCVIFDMDGVIIDSEYIHKKAYYETFTSLGLEVSEELYKTITGSSTLNVFQKLVTHFNLNLDPNELVLKKRKYYIDYFHNDPSLKLVDGVNEIIKYFFDKGLTLILASSASMPNINRVFDRFELNQYFAGKISGADLKESKPHPEIFEKASIMANSAKEQCIIIEDSDNGIKAANRAGIFVFGYLNPMSSDQTLENANKVISEFNELKEFI
ncbi:haloacid dehalogenase superfamily, subfamily IA, variant 3 with third motif having DD or ED [Tenacibaculum sp. MAR_2009_124]|uniref:HAD family hydrolase n=1 Tax=Tenacibaculum sp. MAR_2009_124 TaxID=1250059 RepID=UPI0008977E24|nr:HAD family phosphatase [Tenacibaculum sp. MAR_2009_124]SEB39170.1 haloacid dehalogenase superfamily, subfamily IA, variant 3 with third motif having DD or ED [Tenacibaculum sp. MAR_2009_124]